MIGSYYVVLRKGGSRQAVGYLGPYSSRAGGTLTDASTLKREGLTVEVATEPPESLVGARSNPAPALAAAGRAILAHPRTKQLIVQIAIPYIKDRVVGGLSEFQGRQRRSRSKPSASSPATCRRPTVAPSSDCSETTKSRRHSRSALLRGKRPNHDSGSRESRKTS
jgi:hypothetical protein